MVLPKTLAFEMNPDETVEDIPDYTKLLEWTAAETYELTDQQLDYDDLSPEKEWMWWSCRRQVSHMCWDALVFPKKRCGELLWPNQDPPNIIHWPSHQFGKRAKFDRVLDEDLFWTLPTLLLKLEVGIGWLNRVMTENDGKDLRLMLQTVTASAFWKHVISTLPRGTRFNEEDKTITYTLEASLWMVFYEILSHIRSIQRLKSHQGLSPVIELPRVGYLTLPHYWGDTNENGPSQDRL